MPTTGKKMRFDVVNKRSVIAILVILAVGNGVWWITSARNIILVAVAAYTVVAVAVLRGNDFRAGLMVGIAGFAIHAAELVVQGIAGLRPLERVWLAANIVLPLTLVWLNWVLIRRISSSGSNKNDNDTSGHHN